MINEMLNHVAWVGLLTELDDAREHLEELIKKIDEAGVVDDSVYEATPGHVFVQLNRAWHSRNQAAELTEEQWESFSQNSKDLKPLKAEAKAKAKAKAKE